TATNQLFLLNPQLHLWRFEVTYTFISETSVSSLNFIINQPPYNGSCSITPLNGTTTSLFDISCPDWFDEDGIRDYAVYAWTNDLTEQIIVAYSAVPTFQVRLPSGDNQTLLLHLIVYIRDTLHCIAQFNLSSVNVIPDLVGITNLVNNIQNLSSGITTNPIVQLLAAENQNVVAQLIISLSQELNKMNNDNIDKAISNGIPVTSISISSFGYQILQGLSIPINKSALVEYNTELNKQANVRDYLITFITNLAITSLDSIKLQASSLAQFTKATNQLTRTTLTLAADRCHQLTIALYLQRTRIPYEDVQTAATQLIQCAANLLSAVNGPLQQRTTILNLDSLRATTFPSDYDTDLESEWSNLNLFADGNDFSWETIEKGRNIYYQSQLANQIAIQMNDLVSLLTSTLNIHLNIEQSILINTSQVLMSLKTKTVEIFSNKYIQQIENAQIQFPENLNLNYTKNSKISIRSIIEPLAPFGIANTNLSRLVTFSIIEENEISIQTNVNHPIEIIIPRDPNILIPSMILQNVTSMNFTPYNQLFHLHYLDITSSLSISIHFEIQPLNIGLAYLFIYKFDQLPQLNSSINNIDGWTLFCPLNLTNETLYKYFINNQQTSGHQSIIYGLRELNSTEMMDSCSNTSINSPPITDQRFNFTSNYQLRIYTSGCYYLDKTNQWKSDGLIVGPLTNHYETQCFSSHLTSFAGGFIILPESINWSYIFANADFMKNKTIYLTVICVSVIYIILIIYAHFKDKKDLEKLGVTPLPDNHQSDEYFYQIIIFTGQRKGAGTDSNVHFVLYGDDDETHIRTLADPHRKILQRGGIDSFIMAVPKSLGLLNHLRIWHDNTGKGSSSSWFLKYIIIRDLQTMEKFHFISQRWFAVEKDDGKIERILSVANEIEKQNFSYLLTKRTYHSISDGHLWFSIFSRPPSNKFTRIQRCTCCFVLFFISMFLNIMYYDLSNEAKTSTDSLSFGSLYITRQQISIGIIVELFALIPSLLIVQLFRRLQSRKKQISPLHQTLYKIKPELNINEKQIKKKFSFPWWCIFIAYGLSILLVGLSIIFIIARGIEFGDEKTQKWLISILSGFFSSIIFTQPLKIIGLAIFFACFCQKNSYDDKEANEYLDNNQLALDNDEEYLHSIQKKSLFTYRQPIRVNRLNESEINSARQQRLKEIHMWSIIREILIYICFLTVLYNIIYSNRNSNSFLQVNHSRKFFLNSRQINCDYTKISKIDEYWNWLQNNFIENIRAQQWYNGEPPKNLSGFINDKSNRLIGWATMRQLRVKSTLCQVQNEITSTCQYDYSFHNEDKYSYKPGWKNSIIKNYSSSITQSFQYSTSKDLDTYIYVGEHGRYSGNGYVYEFRGRLVDLQSNLSLLHQLQWINNQTRAIVIQLTLYNPNVQLFTSVTFLAEFLSTTGIFTTARFEPLSFYAFTSIIQLICLIIYMIIILYFMWIEIRSVLKLKWKYFQQFWSYIEIGIICCSWINIGIYIWRYNECKRIGKLFNETNGYVYINLQLTSYINDILIFLLSFCCFFGTIKLLKLCRFNQRLCLFIQTLQYAGKELLSFSMMFSIVFISFVSLFYLLFISELDSCSSLFKTARMLFEMTLMQFNAHQFNQASTFLGPFCFSIFIILVVFICMSMFIAIINDNFRRAKENVRHNNNEDIISFMIKKFQYWTGMKKVTEEEILEERNIQMRSEYYDPIESFPDKIDQLLNALNQIYITQTMEKPTRIKETTF
ncbi:unnamed protein product, partial [Adineta steineri]